MERYLISILLFVAIVYCDLLKEHPSKFPGHLEPMAAKSIKNPVESINYFPEPDVFFRDYVDKSRPVLFKNVVKDSEAYRNWSDDFLKSSEESKKAMVYVEPGLKENRTNPGGEMSLSEFINRYHDEEMYLVAGVPQHLMPDVPIPSMLRCEETKKLLLDAVTWFSSGGTKSVLHNDDLDNINCLYRGSKDLLFIEYPKYKDQVVLDRPQGGYSALDVEKVDFVKYPGLREVEYVYARMEEGDCLFIPFKWYHQVNSFRNEESKQNLAINVWFTHVHKHEPKTCTLDPKEATLSKFQFSDLEKQKYSHDNSTDEEQPNLISTFEGLLQATKSKTLNKKQFLKVIPRADIFDGRIAKMKLPGAYKETVSDIFRMLDADSSKLLSIEDFDTLEKQGSSEFEAQLEAHVATLQDLVTDYVEAQHHGLSEEEFEKNREEKLEQENKAEKPLMGSDGKSEL